MKKIETNNVDLGGEFMIQDHDHMVQADSAKGTRSARQSDQSQAGGRQQGDDQGSNRQQGGDQGRRRR
jgi:hypothetical protein